ncbi:MAG: CvpA family protein [Lentisphaerae bacterium]|nr:CvpA family protein [Lentisphaerota bacterium]
MNVLDYVFLGLVLVGTIRGAMVGLSRQLFGLFMVVVAVWASGRFYADLASTLATGGRMESRTSDIAAYVLIFAGVCVVFFLARLLLKALIKFGFTPLIEKLGGALVGGLMGAISAAAAMVALSLIPNDTIHAAVTRESTVGRRLNETFPSFYRRLSERYNLPDIKELSPPPEPDSDPAPGGGGPTPPATGPAAGASPETAP